jgi:hypothetical protein
VPFSCFTAEQRRCQRNGRVIISGNRQRELGIQRPELLLLNGFQ